MTVKQVVSTKEVYYLAIESSCDDTSVSVMKNEMVLSNVIARQDIHEEFGGVVPELASREHQKNIVPVTEVALKRAGIDKSELSFIAYTRGPGLLGSLHVGSSFAKSLSLALEIPLIESHHMQAHVLAHFIKENENSEVPEFPLLCLTVSGGHTQIVLLNSHSDFKVIGQTIDDAAGEAFDKAAKIMGLPYPGGPLIDKLASEGDPNRFNFSEPRIEAYDFSFSGLKTSFLYFLQKEIKLDETFVEKNKADLCASLQRVIVKILMDKFYKAVDELGVKNVAIAGGVSANSGLRKAFQVEAEIRGLKSFIPDFQYCTDNAAMIGISAWYNYKNGERGSFSASPKARWSL